ncbi:MAG: polysaccharide deacetylase family protein [archaeon]
MVKIRKKFCLTFDIEEFDIAKGITEEEKYSVSFEGTKRILNLLKEEGIKATFFVTAKFTEKYPEIIREISKEHEIGSHGYTHNDNYQNVEREKAYELLKQTREAIEKIIKKEIKGFRAPRMMKVNPVIVKKAGFKYDSSYQPALIPGRSLDFFGRRKIHRKDGMIIIPTSVTPLIFGKIPLMWYGFRNYGLTYAKPITILSAINTNYICVYFHSWEFVDLSKYELKDDIKKNTGEKLNKMLSEYIRWCKKKYDFTTISKMIKDHEVELSTNW